MCKFQQTEIFLKPDDATGNCELYGSHLLQIDGFEENFCLLEYVHSHGFPTGGFESWYWHSANDIRSEGVWRQYDGEMISWSPWFWDQINDGTASNCAIIALGEDKNAGQWADEPCTNVRHYICER